MLKDHASFFALIYCHMFHIIVVEHDHKQRVLRDALGIITSGGKGIKSVQEGS